MIADIELHEASLIGDIAGDDPKRARFQLLRTRILSFRVACSCLLRPATFLEEGLLYHSISQTPIEIRDESKTPHVSGLRTDSPASLGGGGIRLRLCHRAVVARPQDQDIVGCSGLRTGPVRACDKTKSRVQLELVTRTQVFSVDLRFAVTVAKSPISAW